jgi:membrane protease YdiL (CAAX protease family)
MNISTPATSSSNTRLQLYFAWGLVLLLTLPQIILGAFLHMDTAWLVPARILLLALMIVLSFAWTTIRPLRGLFIIFLVVYAVEGWFFLTLVPSTQSYQNLVGTNTNLAFFGERLLRIGAVIIMFLVLLFMGLKRRDFYLALGDLNATAEPSPRGIPRKPESWRKFGRNYALISIGLLLLFMVPAFQPSLTNLSISLVLFAALCAAMNAFAEEFLYRSALLPQVLPLFGKNASLLLVPLWFGLAHYFGVPNGITGIIITAIGGWFFAKSMVETRGMGWAWFLHFLADFTVYLVLLLANQI